VRGRQNNTRLRFEVLEQRRLLTAATDVTLQVATSSGDAQLIFNGSQQISGYEIDSASGQLIPGNWHSLNSQGNSGWSALASTSKVIAEGDLTGTLTASTKIDLGDIFSVGGTHDLSFKWSDALNNSYTPAVAYVTQAPDLTINSTHAGTFKQGDSADQYTLTVNNIGTSPTSGLVTVTDTLPTGLTATATAGSDWTVMTGTGSTVTATRSDALAAGQGYPPLTVTVGVAANAPASVTNMAQVAGGGDVNTANNSASDVTAITQVADLTISASHTASFQQGDAADSYKIAVTNIGAGPTTGTVTVTDNFPTGLTATAVAGSGWTVVTSTGSSVTATRSDTLPAGQSYPPLTVTVSVAANAPASVTNTAQVSGGGELNTANDTASDPTTITVAAPDLTISKSHSGSFKQGDPADTYTISVGNIGSLPTTGLVTVTDILPAGLSPVSAAGTGWTTQISGSTVTATRSDALAAKGTYQALTITVSVANSAPASVTNTATVAGGGEINTANNSSSDATTITQVADLTVSASHSGNFRQGDVVDNYTIAVNNIGAGPTSGVVTVTDTLPVGLMPTAAVGTGWTTQISGTTVTATRSDVLAAGAGYPALTVTASVAANAAANVTNTVTVAGGGEVNTANDSSSDATTITQVADLTITKSHTGNFREGDTADNYTITVNNIGAGPTGGVVAVTDTLPTGLAPTAASGTGWTTQISGSTVTATRSDVLAAGATYPALTVTVSVAANAAASVTNTASVAGGGEVNTANDSASDPTTIAAMPDLTIAASHSGNFKQGDSADLYAITVSNVGQAATSGAVTVTDTLPAGLTPTAASGSGWSTSISGSTVTATRSDALASGTAYPVLNVTVSVAANTAASVTNTVTVAGGGEVNTLNDAASDPTTVTATSGTLAGFVYFDSTNNGQRLTAHGTAKTGLSGVTVRLLSQNSQGVWTDVSGMSPVKTGVSGSYSFTNLPAGTYRLQVAPPGNFLDGTDAAGKIGGGTRGTVSRDQIQVQLAGGEHGTEYNFAMKGLQTRVFSLRMFLASAKAFSQFLQTLVK